MSLFYNTEKRGNPIFSQTVCGYLLLCNVELKNCWMRVEYLFPTPITKNIGDFQYTYDLFRNKLTWR